MTDLELVQQAAAGDMEAVCTLYHRYASFVRTRARRLGAGDDVEDVVQELFTRLAEGRGWQVTHTADGTLHAFIAVQVKALVYERTWRNKYWGDWPEFEGDIVPLWRLPDETPEQRTLRLERTTRLRAALASLPQRLRQVAHLRYLECLSGPAIADRLGLSPRSIPSYLAWIRERVRPALALVYQLPAAGRGGQVRFDREHTRTPGQVNYNAKRRRARALAAGGRVPRGPKPSETAARPLTCKTEETL